MINDYCILFVVNIPEKQCKIELRNALKGGGGVF